MANNICGWLNCYALTLLGAPLLDSQCKRECCPFPFRTRSLFFFAWCLTALSAQIGYIVP